MKFIYFKTIILMAVMLAISFANQALAVEMEVLCNDPTGNSIPTEVTNAYSWTYSSTFSTNDVIQEYIIPQAEIDAGLGRAGKVKSLALHLYGSATNNLPAAATIKIFLANVPWTDLSGVSDAGVTRFITNADMDALGLVWEEVFSMAPFSYTALHEAQFGTPAHYNKTNNPEEEWVKFTFNKDFDYTGGAILVKACFGRQSGAGYAHTEFSFIQMGGGTGLAGPGYKTGKMGNNAAGQDLANCNDTRAVGIGNTMGNNRPWFKLGMELPDLPSQYVASELQQATSYTATRPNEKNIPVVKLAVRTDPGEHPITVEGLEFNGKTSIGVITSAKLYYTGVGTQAANSFDITTAGEPIAELTFPDATGNNNVFSFTPNKELTGAGWHNFWLVYDIFKDSPIGENIVDAKITNMSLSSDLGDVAVDPAVSNPDPEGGITLLTNGYYYSSAAINQATGMPVGTVLTVGDEITDNYFPPSVAGSGPGFNNNMEYNIIRYPASAFGSVPGDIRRLAFYVTWQYNVVSGQTDMLDNVYIFMKNSDNASGVPVWPDNIGSHMSGIEVRGDYYQTDMFTVDEFAAAAEADGFTLVKSAYNWDIPAWPTTPLHTILINNEVTTTANCATDFWTEDVELDTKFNYTGGSVDVIIFKSNWRRAPGELSVNRRFALGTLDGTNGARFGYAFSVPRNDVLPSPLTVGTFQKVPYGPAAQANGYQGTVNITPAPLMRTYITYIEGEYYKQPFFFAGATGTAAGTKNANIRGVCIEIAGVDEAPYVYLKDLGFKITNDYSLVKNAKLYYTGNDSAFTANRQLGTDIAINSASDLTPKFDLADAENVNGLKLGLGKHFFWLSCEVATDAPEGAELTAEPNGATILKVDANNNAESFDITALIVDNAPESKTVVNTRMKGGTYRVGAGGSGEFWRATLSELASDITRRGVDGDVIIEVTSNINENAPAIFGVSPSVDGVNFTIRSATSTINTITYSNNAPENASNPALWLVGVKNFTIQNLNLTRSNYGPALKLSGVDNVLVEHTELSGASDVIELLASNNFKIQFNTLLGSSNYGINMRYDCTNGSINHNTFGSSTNGLYNGIAMQDGTRNIDVISNNFHSLKAGATQTVVFNIAGQYDRDPLHINIGVNTINDIKASESASVFEINNASDVNIYHNTVIIKDASTAVSVQIFNLPTNTNSLLIKNNLFSNTAPVSDNSVRHQFFLIADRATPFVSPTDIDNNLYNSNPNHIFGRNINVASTVFSLNDWIANGYEINSHIALSATAQYYDTYHTDGSIINEIGMLCPVLVGYPNSSIDASGAERGDDVYPEYQNYTTVGADEAKIKISTLIDELPETTFNCASAGSGISYRVHKIFAGWQDGVTRTFNPQFRNYWYNTLGEALTEQQGWMANESTEDQYLGLPSPNADNTCELYCLTRIGYFESRSDTSTLIIISPPYIYNIDDQYVCANSERFGVSADIEGTYQAWQWQKNTSNGWVNTEHSGQSFYDVSFEQDFTSPSEIEGSYRLILYPYTNCGDNTPTYVSNEFKVVVGNLLYNSTPALTISHPEEVATGLCVNTANVWLACGIPTGNTDKDVMSYQWYKQNPGSEEWLPISSTTNLTANSDTLKFAYLRSSDAGTYRCQVIGIPTCGFNNNRWSPNVTFEVNLTDEITQAPVSNFACVGDVLIDGFSIELFEPDNANAAPTFQWYKDGKPLVREKTQFTASGNRIISLKTNERTLSFERIRLEDGGEYYLEMTYVNCAGNLEVLKTEPVYLTVKDKTFIISQSTKIYGVHGGYTSLEVLANTSGRPLEDNAITYQWYRHYSDSRGDVMLMDNAKFYGSQTSLLTVININDDDIAATDEDYYYCVIKDWCMANSLISQPVKLALAPNINITTHPSATAVCEGENVTLTVEATSTDPTYQMYYQWFKDGTLAAIDEGNDKNTLTLNSVTPADATNYYCVVSFVDLTGSNKSTSKALLTVESKPVITNFIYPTTAIAEGQPLRLEITTADPTGVYSYEWYLNGFPITGYDNAVYYVEKTTTIDRGRYHCIVKSVNGCGEAFSDTVNIGITGIIENDDPFFHIESVLPNPVTNDAVVNFVLPEASPATLTLLDLAGKELAVLHSGNFAEGTNQVQISNKLNTVANGTYFVILESKGRKTAMKITISR